MSSRGLPSPLATLFDHLNSGVAIFFVISGFLLYRPFVAARRGLAPNVAIRRFYTRRMLRIMPAYWVALTLLAVYPGLKLVHGPDWWRFYAFAQVYSQRTYLGGIVPAWSLCVEMSFYLLLPLLAVLIARFAIRRPAVRSELALLTALAAMSLAFRQVVFHTEPQQYHPYLVGTLLGTFQWFAVGMGLAVVDVAGGCRRANPRWCGVGAVAAMLVAAFGPQQDAIQQILYACIGGFIVLAAIAELPPGAPRRVLGHPTLAWLGLVSYGIFLWHYPITLKLAASGTTSFIPLMVLGALIPVAIAAASYYVIESPFIRLKDARR